MNSSAVVMLSIVAVVEFPGVEFVVVATVFVMEFII